MKKKTDHKEIKKHYKKTSMNVVTVKQLFGIFQLKNSTSNADNF